MVYKIYEFLDQRLGPFLGKLSGNIKSLPKKSRDLDINAQFNRDTGDIFLREEMEENISYLLGNLFHELIHSNVGDTYTEPFYSEGFIDYLCEILSKDDFWGPYQSMMFEGFVSSNKQREEKAKEQPTEFNVDRWLGQQWARENIGLGIVEAIKRAKVGS